MPPKVIISKAFGKLSILAGNFYQKKSDLAKTTYKVVPAEFEYTMSPIFHFPYKEYLEAHRSEIEDYAAQSLAHKFNLLGSKGAPVKHGMFADGIEGIKFPKGNPFSSWKVYINQKINPSNKIEAIKIAEMISEDYEPIDWLIDFRSGYRWNESDWHKDVGYGGVIGADIKMPWEIGRMQDLPILAYHAKINPESKDACYKEFINRLTDFWASNPPNFGVQWITAMDVSIRISNILIAFDLFGQLGIIHTEKEQDLVDSLAYNHIEFIIGNFEWAGGARANHYLANICGLIVSLTYYKQSEYADSWLNFAIVELVAEINMQFGNDGGNFEASVPYHFFAVNMIVCALNSIISLSEERIKEIFAVNSKKIRKENLKIWQELKEKPQKSTIIELISDKLIQIEKFSKSILQANGHIPLIGDNDSGYFFLSKPNFKKDSDGSIFIDVNSGRNILNELSYIIEKYKLKENQENVDSNETITLLGSFPDFGLYIIQNEDAKCLIRCGSIGQNGKGGHTHNDQLSFELSIGEVDVIVDPGNYVYTSFPDLRNKYRSTDSHNTLIIKGVEQNAFIPGGKGNLFWMDGDRAKAKCLKHTGSFFEGVHQGYVEEHKRTFAFKEEELIISDKCAAQGEKELHFHFAPSVEVKKISEKMVKVSVNDMILELTIENSVISIEQYQFAEGYGRIIAASRVIAKLGGIESECRITYRRRN